MYTENSISSKLELGSPLYTPGPGQLALIKIIAIKTLICKQVTISLGKSEIYSKRSLTERKVQRRLKSCSLDESILSNVDQ